MELVTKNCPYCGEEILAVAKKCKHCGEWLTQDNDEMDLNPNFLNRITPKTAVVIITSIFAICAWFGIYVLANAFFYYAPPQYALFVSLAISSLIVGIGLKKSNVLKSTADTIEVIRWWMLLELLIAWLPITSLTNNFLNILPLDFLSSFGTILMIIPWVLMLIAGIMLWKRYSPRMHPTLNKITKPYFILTMIDFVLTIYYCVLLWG